MIRRRGGVRLNNEDDEEGRGCKMRMMSRKGI